jgi:2-polyprenyl-6-methoxyphenol hydroxylase-like FAD-dependent oxidoreductase
MPTRRCRVLVSGASVAGPVLAYWLQRLGFSPTLVERTPEVRVGGGGHAVDLFGPAVTLMEWMGTLPEIEANRTRTRFISLVGPGRPAVEVPAEALAEGVSSQHIEIMRGDLAKIIYELTRENVEYIFDDSVATLQQGEAEVQVTFERNAPRTFDLVVGADGLHSTTRRLVFGAEHQFLRFLGGYLAVFTVPNYLKLTERMVGSAAPGRTAALYPVGDGTEARVVLLWRTPTPHDYDRHDRHSERQLVRNLYDDFGWELPRLLSELERSDDLYLDSISQVVMPTWIKGRVALVGDAGYSPGPAVGGGTSLAVIGAYMLASELAVAGGNHVEGFAAYERALGPVVQRSRSIGPTVMRLIIPRSRAQVWTMVQAMRLLPHLPARLRQGITSFGGSAAAMLNEVRLRQPPDVLHGG